MGAGAEASVATDAEAPVAADAEAPVAEPTEEPEPTGALVVTEPTADAVVAGEPEPVAPEAGVAIVPVAVGLAPV